MKILVSRELILERLGGRKTRNGDTSISAQQVKISWPWLRAQLPAARAQVQGETMEVVQIRKRSRQVQHDPTY